MKNNYLPITRGVPLERPPNSPAKSLHADQFHVGEGVATATVRAKYYITPDGTEKLAQVQQLGLPRFVLPGFELPKTRKDLDELFDEQGDPPKPSDTPEQNARRALRRAKANAFDKILANPELDLFATFTVSPDTVKDRTSWDDVYRHLKVWLSNRVTRSDLKYVICPERHKAGGIHFHGIMNSSALKLAQATNPHTGEPLTHNGQPLYNVADFTLGFTSAERIQSATLDREKVAKYIFKYMGKQGTEGKIGGRYALIGGKLASPFYRYGNDPTEFIAGTSPTGEHTSEHEGITYHEWTFI